MLSLPFHCKANETPKCPEDFMTINGTCIKLMPSNVFCKANLECAKLNGRLIGSNLHKIMDFLSAIDAGNILIITFIIV